MTTGLLSCGYQGRTLEEFVAALVEADVGAVADVRLTPSSRKPGFSKTRLSQALGAAGIAYVHLRGLGNPRSNREPFRSGRVDEGRAVFREFLSDPDAVAELEWLRELSARTLVAVLCFERDQGFCHRQVVIDEVTRRRDLPVSVLA